MKSKAPLSLMEQLIMLLVFALAAALCLQVFVLSGRVSRSCETKSNAVAAVQSAAEITKACKGDTEQLEQFLGGSDIAGTWQLGYNKNWEQTAPSQAYYLVNIKPVPTENPVLGSAEVSAHSPDGTLFSVTVSWQEVAYE